MSESALRFDEIKKHYLTAEGRNDIVGMKRAIEEFMALDSFEGRMYAHIARGTLHILAGDLNAARVEFMKRMEVFEPLGPSKDLLNTWTGLGRVAMYQEDMVAALVAFQHALDIAGTIGDLAAQAGANSNIGIVLQYIGDYVGALPYLQRGLQLSRETGHRQFEANITNNIGMLHLSMRQLDEALVFFEQATEQLSALGSLNDALGVQCNIAIVHMGTGHHAVAEQGLKSAIDRSKELGAFRERADLAVILTDLLMESERIEEARILLDEYAEDIKRNPRAAHKAARTRAHLMELEGDLDGAKKVYMDLLQHAQETNNRGQQLDHHKDLCELARKMKDFDAYVHHNEMYQQLHSKVSGAEASRLYAVQEKQHELSILNQERERERAVLYSTLPQHIAERIIRGEDVSGDHHERAAVLFLDVVGFTTHSSSMHPSDTVKLLEKIFEHFDALCERYGVTKVKTIGDSYMCFAHGGIGEQEMGNSPQVRMASVAIAMQQAEFYWPINHQESRSERLVFRIGIHSGPITAGVIGTQRLQYDVWGDTVNVASRMESTSEPGRIHVSSSFALALKSEMAKEREGETDVIPSMSEEQSMSSQFPVPCSLIERGALEIKGKGTMTTYWLEEA